MLTASVGYYIVDHYSLIGASGGIYCLIAACIPDIIVNWKESRAIFVQVLFPRKTFYCVTSLHPEVQTRPGGSRV